MKPYDYLIAVICITMILHLALASVRVRHGTVGGFGEITLTWAVLMLVLIGGGQWALAERGK